MRSHGEQLPENFDGIIDSVFRHRQQVSHRLDACSIANGLNLGQQVTHGILNIFDLAIKIAMQSRSSFFEKKRLKRRVSQILFHLFNREVLHLCFKPNIGSEVSFACGCPRIVFKLSLCLYCCSLLKESARFEIVNGGVAWFGVKGIRYKPNGKCRLMLGFRH